MLASFEGIFIPHSHYMSVNADYYIFARIKPQACQWIPYTVWWPSMCLLNLAIQDVASMAAKTCSLGSLCKQYFILQLYSL